jgi:hypothetical protein
LFWAVASTWSGIGSISTSTIDDKAEVREDAWLLEEDDLTLELLSLNNELDDDTSLLLELEDEDELRELSVGTGVTLDEELVDELSMFCELDREEELEDSTNGDLLDELDDSTPTELDCDWLEELKETSLELELNDEDEFLEDSLTTGTGEALEDSIDLELELDSIMISEEELEVEVLELSTFCELDREEELEISGFWIELACDANEEELEAWELLDLLELEEDSEAWLVELDDKGTLTGEMLEDELDSTFCELEDEVLELSTTLLSCWDDDERELSLLAVTPEIELLDNESEEDEISTKEEEDCEELEEEDELKIGLISINPARWLAILSSLEPWTWTGICWPGIEITKLHVTEVWIITMSSVTHSSFARPVSKTKFPTKPGVKFAKQLIVSSTENTCGGQPASITSSAIITVGTVLLDVEDELEIIELDKDEFETEDELDELEETDDKELTDELFEFSIHCPNTDTTGVVAIRFGVCKVISTVFEPTKFWLCREKDTKTKLGLICWELISKPVFPEVETYVKLSPLCVVKAKTVSSPEQEMDSRTMSLFVFCDDEDELELEELPPFNANAVWLLKAAVVKKAIVNRLEKAIASSLLMS